MLLAHLTLWITLGKGERLSKETGHFISKELAREITRKSNKIFLGVYPSNINTNSLEFIVEIIGHAGTSRGNQINLGYVQDIIIKIITDLVTRDRKIVKTQGSFFFDYKACLIEEIPFTAAAAQMIYCYKQDDYLIPDSDPHDVVNSENIYHFQDFCYSGRFLPMIKLWCDIVQPSNSTFMGNIIREDDPPISKVKQLEMDAFSSRLLKKEIAVLQSQEKLRRPFNKYYKILITSRTMIYPYVKPIIEENFKAKQLISKSYYVLDYLEYFHNTTYDNRYFEKMQNLLLELRGSTLVLLIDVPNLFMDPKIGKMVQSEHYNISERVRSDESPMDALFFTRMCYYNLMDIDDALDYPPKSAICRDIVNTYLKATENGGVYKDHEQFIYFLLNLLRDTNLIVAYTDFQAYKEDFLLTALKEDTTNLSIKQVALSKTNLTKNEYYKLAQSIAMIHFNVSEIRDIPYYVSYMAMLKQCTDALAETTKDKLISLYEFRFAINEALDYGLPDTYGESYFRDQPGRKKKKKKAVTAKDSTKPAGEEPEYTDDDDEEYDETPFNIPAGGMFAAKVARKNQLRSEELELELDEMIGLESIKKEMLKFASFTELSQLRMERGLAVPPISKHMVFSGNPGTAKTTIARMMGKLLHSRGIIPTANVKHISRENLVGQYVGWTAKLVADAIEEAQGGILFIDEAYALIMGEGGTNSYGMEAINTLVNAMDKPEIRESTIIIFAGYKDLMKDFIDSNPGLKSRIGFFFDFPDYSTDELIEIAKLQAKKATYILSEGYLEKLRKEIIKQHKAKDFGNGRFVRSIFEKSILKQSTRLSEDIVKTKNLNDDQLITLTEEDFSIDGLNPTETKRIGFCTAPQDK